VTSLVTLGTVLQFQRCRIVILHEILFSQTFSTHGTCEVFMTP